MIPINPKIFDKDVQQAPIRKGFGEGLLAAGELDHNIVALCADLTESTMMHLFKNKFPNRFVEMGIMEQSMASIASGMAAMGKIPFFSSYAMFSPGRNWEQIRTTIAYNNVNAKIVGSHAGISVGPDGGTHQAVEDMGLMRLIPRMIVVAPCDAIEAKKATLAVAKWDAKAYFAKPSMIIAHTIPGKGVEFTERRPEWHGNPPGKGSDAVVPKDKQGEVALNELRTLGGRIKSEH